MVKSVTEVSQRLDVDVDGVLSRDAVILLRERDLITLLLWLFLSVP